MYSRRASVVVVMKPSQSPVSQAWLCLWTVATAACSSALVGVDCRGPVLDSSDDGALEGRPPATSPDHNIGESTRRAIMTTTKITPSATQRIHSRDFGDSAG